MPSSERLPLWWDRDADDQGCSLRADVREAGHRIWESVCGLARRVLGDCGDAPELLEAAIRSISRYLEKKGIPPGSTDPSGLLVLAVYRGALRLARQRNRLEPVGGSSELAHLLRAPDYSNATDARLFLERLSRELSDKSRAILRLRIAGYDWKQIGRTMRISAEAARQSFWRDVRKAHLRLLQDPGRSSDKPRTKD